MITNNSISEINISTPVGVYIEVKGFLNKNLSEVLGGLNIKNVATANNIPISHIVGTVTDQAGLIGILNTLYNMRFPIINIEINSNKNY